MQEYAVSQVLHWFRRFDDYQALKQQARWLELEEYRAKISPSASWGGCWGESGRQPERLGFSAALLESFA
jgi:hypothetical protein